ncbi:hypothetical protein MLD38_001434 [Melastoma candidum]|uniref:Uncharacterized protein n=1 Tax=Melastoma candidum TaxID=119954 RepID=A0ACB9SE75_9MYRT|nr:hypothetical protein MLD38_001434 [Melastoma candidum]
MPKSSHVSSDVEMPSAMYVHTISEAGRMLPSDSKWNSIELNFGLYPKSRNNYESLPSKYSKSYEYNMVITDKKDFKRFIGITMVVVLLILVSILLAVLLPRKHKHDSSSKNLTLAVNQALTFFDAQKSGNYPKNSPVKFRGDSGLQDGNISGFSADLVGGFYDSGNNQKFSLPTAYMVTLLSWTVLEYHEKYSHISELDHIRDIIKWGSDYLMKVFVTSNATSNAALYSQVGGARNNTKDDAGEDDNNCWTRPEDMAYPRPGSRCDATASDLAGEIVAGLSAASLVFKDNIDYARQLTERAETLFNLAIKQDPARQGLYTTDNECGAEARPYYNSTSFRDELVWGGTWLFLATGNPLYLAYATGNFSSAADEEVEAGDKGVLYWNNKQLGNAVLLTRILYFHDLGYPYEVALSSSREMTETGICSYLTDKHFRRTPGGLILLQPDKGSPLEFAATASFTSKLFKDYLDLIRKSGWRCGPDAISVKRLHSFSISQINYILGDNPMKMSYLVGFGDHYPKQVHHRAASIPWDGQKYTCSQGDKWLNSKDPNPNILSGAMVSGPDEFDNFLDERGKPWFTQPSISSNAGLVAALVAHLEPPRRCPIRVEFG